MISVAEAAIQSTGQPMHTATIAQPEQQMEQWSTRHNAVV